MQENERDFIIHQPPEFKGIRTDLRYVSHVSYLLSKDSVKKIYEYLKENNIPNFLYNEKTQHYRSLGVTVAYSYEPINQITPWYDKDSSTTLIELGESISIDIGSLNLQEFVDPDGVCFDVIILEHPYFNRAKEILERQGAVWHLGEFVPFIKINNECNLNKLGIKDANLPEFSDSIIVDRKRLMFFGESIQTF